MITFDLRTYANLFQGLEDQDSTFALIEAENSSEVEFGKVPSAKLDDDELEALTKRIRRMSEFADTLGLSTSQALLKPRIASPPQTRGEWRILLEAIYAELKGKLFLYVPDHRAKFYERPAPPWAVAPFFASASADMQSAGSCFATGQSTACVFHLMRVLEHGLRSLAAATGVLMGSYDSASWGDLIGAIQSEIKKMQTGGRPTAAGEKQFFSDAAAQFGNFKDAWRNYVSHARGPCSEVDALKLLNDVPHFMAHLATRLQE